MVTGKADTRKFVPCVAIRVDFLTNVVFVEKSSRGAFGTNSSVKFFAQRVRYSLIVVLDDTFSLIQLISVVTRKTSSRSIPSPTTVVNLLTLPILVKIPSLRAFNTLLVVPFSASSVCNVV